ncbi:MAG: cobalamin biosynthesis protein CbiX [Acidimicrobiales bacterium]|nr:cobalamin biosynthesis protein CbiX [Acidimicrobiales bacterium]
MEPQASSPTTAVVLVAHGSRASEANRSHLELAARLDARIEPTVIGAFMELAEPSIGDAVRRAADGGATVVAVLPYFLHPGRHQQKDIPELVAEAADSRPGIEVRVVEHFGSDPAVVDLLAAQVARALAP